MTTVEWVIEDKANVILHRLYVPASTVAVKNDTPLLGGIESLLKASGASERIRQHVLSQLLCLGAIH
jgi:hypothetical protein